MKNLFLVLICWVGSWSALHAQAKAEQAIRRVMADQEAAWNRGDIPAFMEGYWRSDSLIFIGKRGCTYGWQPTLASYQRGYPDRATMGTLHFDIVRLEVLSRKSAYLIGKWHLTRTKGDVGGYFTLLWKKVAGKWVVAADHTSSE